MGVRVSARVTVGLLAGVTLGGSSVRVGGRSVSVAGNIGEFVEALCAATRQAETRSKISKMVNNRVFTVAV
jgi:hypothetical protein